MSYTLIYMIDSFMINSHLLADTHKFAMESLNLNQIIPIVSQGPCSTHIHFRMSWACDLKSALTKSLAEKVNTINSLFSKQQQQQKHEKI